MIYVEIDANWKQISSAAAPLVIVWKIWKINIYRPKFN